MLRFRLLAAAACAALILAALPARGADHPALYLDPARIEAIKSRLDAPPYDAFADYALQRARTILQEDVPDSLGGYNDNALRFLGDKLPWLAMAHLLTGENAYVRAARAWMDRFAAAPKWASDKDIGAAHVLFGMAVAYDWLFERIPPEARGRYRRAMARHARILHDVLTEKGIWWARDLLQNHNHTCAMALVVAGTVLRGEAAGADAWLQDGWADIRRVLEVMPADGASFEGVGYWSYSLQSLLKAVMAAADRGGLKAARNSPYLRHTAAFRLYASLPGYSRCIDFADSPRVDYKGPGHQLRALARIFRDPTAQWLAARIDRARGDRVIRSWLDMVWYDPSVQAEPPDELPLHRWFPDLGLLLARTSWSGQGRVAWFKAGPAQGRTALSQGLWAGSHIHPDAGSFGLYSRGHWVVQDDGYVLKKLTSNHNTVVLGPMRKDEGEGQLGEGAKWMRAHPLKQHGAEVKTLSTDLKPAGQMVRVELSRMYPPEAGLRSLERAFAVLNATTVVVRDVVEIRRAETVQSLVHLGTPASWITSGSVCLDQAGYRLDGLGPGASYKLAGYSVQVRPMGRMETRRGTLFAMGAPGPGRVVLAYVLTPGGCGTPSPAVRYDPARDTAVVQTGRGRAVLDFARGELTLP